MALSATGGFPPWSWWLWVAMALQATAGILVVHSRLDARIAARGSSKTGEGSRRAAWMAVAVLVAAAVAAGYWNRWWIAAALAVAAAGYWWDLRSQLDAESLRVPLKAVGLRALMLSTLFALLVIAGLW